MAHRLPIAAQTDLYSLGKTMIYALPGNLELVERNKLPETTPPPLKEFILRLTQPDLTKRPRWEDEDLVRTFLNVRVESFGRESSFA